MVKGVMSQEHQNDIFNRRNVMKWLRDRGDSVNSIAKLMDVHRNTVVKWSNRKEPYENRKKRTCKFDRSIFNLALIYRDEGLSLREIARRLNTEHLIKQKISHTTISNFLLEKKP